MNLLQIDGWYGGGKSVLWALLDGHNDVFVSPIHEASFHAFLKSNVEDQWLKNKDTWELRRRLSKEGYYGYEDAFLKKELCVMISSNNNLNFPYKTDFYNFDKEYFKRVRSLNNWTLEGLNTLLYQTFYEEHTGNKFFPKYVASMGVPIEKDYYTNMLEKLPLSKRILVKRDLKSIISTRKNRQDIYNRKMSNSIDEILESGEIQKILEYFDSFNALVRKYPNNFLSINFDELISNTEETMKVVSNFLEIEYSSILSLPTRDGRLLEQNGESFIGKENDNYENLLTKKEIDIINKEILVYNCRKSEKIINTNNISYSSKLSHTLLNFESLKNEYSKIAIYGNGYLGKLLGQCLGSKLVITIDRNHNNFKDDNIISLSELENYTYDIILISLIDREEEIIRELIDYGVSSTKIRVLFK